MFGLVRLIIGSIVFCIMFFLIRKFTKKHTRSLISGSIMFSIVLVVTMAFVPFENLYTTFETPVKAYNYYNFGKSDIQLIVGGTTSDLIIDNRSGSDHYLIIPRSNNGWKIGIGAETKKIIQKTNNGIVICVYQYKDTADYYITVLDTNGGDTDIADSSNSKFYALKKTNPALGKEFVTYFAHVPALDSQYWICVNGSKIEPLVQ